ncbi:glycine dehydrogenase, partial [candidate division TA06 bacterium SM1_40]
MNILEPTIFDLSQEGRQGAALPDLDVPEKPLEELLPEESLRRDLPHLPEVSEPEVVRHFIHLSSFNHHIDKGFYPLGSCTMKYNPKVNEVSARLPGFARVHPLAPAKTVQGALRLMHELGDLLCRISGLDEVTLQPAAGAQGELAGLMMIRAYHDKRGHRRSKVLIPDSAHGTNPASVTLAGYRSVQVASNDRGLVDIDDLRRAADEEVAALMLTNPNTLGLFESDIEEIERIVHGVGAQLYMDGANLNALLGIARP